MAAFIDATFIENAIGSAEYDAMTESTASIGTQLISQASALVASVLEGAGYSYGYTSVTAPDLVKTATLGAILPMLYGRKQLQVPSGYHVHMNVFEKIRTGELAIPGVDPDDERDAVGGVKFTDSSTTSTDGKPRIFGGLRSVF